MEEMMRIVRGIGTAKNKARTGGNDSWARVWGMGDGEFNRVNDAVLDWEQSVDKSTA